MLRDLWSNQLPYAYGAPANAALLLGRILVCMQLIPNGARKLADFALLAAGMGGAQGIVIAGRPFPDQTPLVYFPFPEAFLALSVLFDVAGALLVIVGLRTRSAALLLAGYVLVAMLIYHSGVRGPQDVQAILRNLPFLGALIIIAGLGAGRWSLDGWLSARGRAAAGALTARARAR